MSMARLAVLYVAVILLTSGCAIWTTNPNTKSADIGWFRNADIAERAALRTLSTLIVRNPRARRYQVTYAYEGKHFGGEVPHRWDYNPRSGNLQDTFEASRELRGRLKNITPADIHQVAKESGTFGRLEVYTKSKNQGRP